MLLRTEKTQPCMFYTDAEFSICIDLTWLVFALELRNVINHTVAKYKEDQRCISSN